MSKKCPTCKGDGPFSKNKSTRNGLQWRCKRCCSLAKRKKGTPGYHYSETRRHRVRIIENGLAWCCQCAQMKPIDNFNKTKELPDSHCKTCGRLHKAALRYGITQEEAEKLYSTTVCECCGSIFEKQRHKHIHHLSTKVIGVVCVYYNILLRDESSRHLRRLKCCIRFIKQRLDPANGPRADDDFQQRTVT